MPRVVFPVSFEVWLIFVDGHLKRHTNRGVDDIPVPERTWRIWYAASYRAEGVALALVEPTVKYLPGATRSRYAGDDQPRRDAEQIWQRIVARREAAVARAG